MPLAHGAGFEWAMRPTMPALSWLRIKRPSPLDEPRISNLATPTGIEPASSRLTIWRSATEPRCHNPGAISGLRTRNLTLTKGVLRQLSYDGLYSW